MNISFTELEQLKAHISDEIQAAFQKQIDPLLKRVDAVEEKANEALAVRDRVSRLEATQAKALVGFSVLCFGVTLLLDQAKDWIVRKVQGR